MAEVNVLVTGNGFDIHHGMKTKYTDFLEFVKDYRAGKIDSIEEVKKPMELLKTNNFITFFIEYSEIVEGWIDFEALIKEVIEFIELYINKLVEDKGTVVNGTRYDYALMCSDALGKMIAKYFDKLFRIDRGLIYLREAYTSILYTVKKDEVIKLLHTELDDLRNILAIYFKYYEVSRRDDEYKHDIVYKQIMDMKIDSVITFNYTNIYERYGVAPVNVTHIHGKAMETYVSYCGSKFEVGLNSIVLGFQDDNEDELDFVYFKKYFQCLYFNVDLITDKSFSRTRNSIRNREDDLMRSNEKLNSSSN